MVRRYLSFLGYRVETACGAEEGCNLFDNDLNCGLVITKMKVGDINGNDIAQYIRNSQQPHTPIIAIGRAEDDIDRCLFNSVLMTPCKLKLFGESVSSFMFPMARV
jgi:DNA-binding response OmpR family regulator